uniref:Uncharacterized protein n=1 Tax=Moniliophthora roreri TaxID=221103 RepID=A0A0W0ETS6_MONRR
MAKLVGTKAAPKHAVAPLPIDTKSLFNLDIDDAIWQNVGLFEEDSHPPAWLADDNVQLGICALLERDCCNEELVQLQHERDSMQVWFAEELC